MTDDDLAVGLIRLGWQAREVVLGVGRRVEWTAPRGAKIRIGARAAVCFANVGRGVSQQRTFIDALAWAQEQ